MNKNMRIVVEQMGPVSIDSNVRANGNWGVLFNRVNTPVGFEWGMPGYSTDKAIVTKDEAWIVGDYFISRWTDFGAFDFDASKPFFNIEETEWTNNTMTVKVGQSGNKVVLSPNMLHEKLEKVRPKTDEEKAIIANQVVSAGGGSIAPESIPSGAIKKLRLPLGNLYNLLAQYNTKAQRDRVRVIVNPVIDPMEKKSEKSILLITDTHPIHGMVAKIWEPARREFYPNIPADKVYSIVNSNKDEAKMNTVAPGQMWECFFVDSKEGMSVEEQLRDCQVVELRDRFFKGIEVMTHESGFGYLMEETLDEVMNSKNYEYKDVLRVPFMNPFEAGREIDFRYFDFPPVSLDCNTLMNVLDLYKGFEWINMYVGLDSTHEIIITGEKPNDKFPTIQTVMTTLKHMKGDCR